MAKPPSVPLAQLETFATECSCHQLAWQNRRWAVVKAARGHFCDQTRPTADLQAIADQLNLEHGRWVRPAGKTSRL